jgi:hypothetical protein
MKRCVAYECLLPLPGDVGAFPHGSYGGSYTDRQSCGRPGHAQARRSAGFAAPRGTTGMIKLLTAPIRSIVRFPLVQLAFVVVLITFLQAADDKSVLGQLFTILDTLVDSTVRLVSAMFNVKSFTRSWLVSGFMIAYVYLACLLILSIARLIIRGVVNFVGRYNAFWLRNAIARERGIAAYRAWVPLERIRPPHIPQDRWEETFAWPADNTPPYPPLPHRIVRGAVSYVIVVVITAVLIQVFTPFPAATWLSHAIAQLATMAPLVFATVATAAAATAYVLFKLRKRAPRANITSPPIPSVR